MRTCIKLAVWAVEYSAGLSHFSFYLKQPLQKNLQFTSHYHLASATELICFFLIANYILKK